MRSYILAGAFFCFMVAAGALTGVMIAGSGKVKTQNQSVSPAASVAEDTPEEEIASSSPSEDEDRKDGAQSDEEGSDPESVPRVYKGHADDGDEMVFVYDRLSHCTADGYLATFEVHGKIPVVALDDIEQDRLNQVTDSYAAHLQPVYDKVVGRWVGRTVARDVSDSFYGKKDAGLNNAVTPVLAEAMLQMLADVTGAMGGYMNGKFNIYGDTLEMSEAPVPECKGRGYSVVAEEHDPFAGLGEETKVPYVFKGMKWPHGDSVLIFDRMGACTADKRLAKFYVTEVFPVSALEDISESQMQALVDVYADTGRMGLYEGFTQWMGGVSAEKVRKVFPALKEYAVGLEEDAEITDPDVKAALEIISAAEYKYGQAYVEGILQIFEYSVWGAVTPAMSHLEISEDVAEVCQTK